MKIEKTPDRLIARSDTMSFPSGLTLIGFLAAWIAVAGKELPKAWTDQSWALAARPLTGIVVGTFLFGGFALFAFGHQRLIMSADGFENAWIIIWPIRRRLIPLQEIKSIHVVTRESTENSSAYLNIHTAKRQVNWSVFGDSPNELCDEFKTMLKALCRKNR